MTSHHAVEFAHKLSKHGQLILIKLFAGAIDLRQLIMSI
jgi:hypothetical protein